MENDEDVALLMAIRTDLDEVYLRVRVICVKHFCAGMLSNGRFDFEKYRLETLTPGRMRVGSEVGVRLEVVEKEIEIVYLLCWKARLYR